MTTKAQELEALNKIREIVEGLGDDSYVGKAFDGCFLQAEENICNDWMLSWKDRYDEEQVKNCKLSERLAVLTDELNRKEDAIARLNDLNRTASEEISLRCDEATKLKQGEREARHRLEDAQEEIKLLQADIIKLKAKLYDYMIKEEEQ